MFYRELKTIFISLLSYSIWSSERSFIYFKNNVLLCKLLTFLNFNINYYFISTPQNEDFGSYMWISRFQTWCQVFSSVMKVPYFLDFFVLQILIGWNQTVPWTKVCIKKNIFYHEHKSEMTAFHQLLSKNAVPCKPRFLEEVGFGDHMLGKIISNSSLEVRILKSLVQHHNLVCQKLASH